MDLNTAFSFFILQKWTSTIELLEIAEKKNLIYIYITYSPLIFLIELWMRKIGVGLNKV